MRVCCLFSGGKDSAYSLHRMLLSGFEVPVLLTIRSGDPDSWLYQTDGLEVSDLYRELTGIQTEIFDSPGNREMEEQSLSGILRDLKDRFDLDAICSGALLSDYQRMRFSHSAMDAGLISYTPLWRKDGKRYMRELQEHGFSYMLVSYSSPGFKEEDLGVPVDEGMLKEFFDISERWGSHPAFEGGEAETLILGGPLFPGRLEVSGHVVREGDYNARFIIEEAQVV